MKTLFLFFLTVATGAFNTNESPDQNLGFDVVMTLKGEMHDKDPVLDPDEHKSWSYNKTFTLRPGGPPQTDHHEECLDNEVALHMDIMITMDNRRSVKVFNTVYLFEGDTCPQELEVRKICNTNEIGPQDPDNKDCHFKIADDQGDWATFYQTIKNTAPKLEGL